MVPSSNPIMNGKGGAKHLSKATESQFQLAVNLRLNSPIDDTLLFQSLPGVEGASVALSFVSIWISVPSGQTATVSLIAPPDAGTDPAVNKTMWIPVVNQGSIGGMDIYVGIASVEFNYHVPNGGSTAPVPSINISVKLSAKSTGTSQAAAYFSGSYLSSGNSKSSNNKGTRIHERR